MVMYTVNKTKQNIVQEFSSQLDVYIENLRNMKKSELKKEILRIEQSYLNKNNKLDFYTIALTQTVYRERFKREVILRGVKLCSSN